MGEIERGMPWVEMHIHLGEHLYEYAYSHSGDEDEGEAAKTDTKSLGHSCSNEAFHPTPACIPLPYYDSHPSEHCTKPHT